MGDRRRCGEDGSALLLFPAALLVVVVLASMAADRAVVLGRQRALVATAQRAADEAVSAGVDLDDLRREGAVRIDPARADRAIRAATAAASDGVRVRWRLDGRTVTVHLEQRVDLIFAPAVPGGSGHEVVQATASADLRIR